MSDVLRQMRQAEGGGEARPRLMERYAAFLPVTGDTPNISLGEGYTPLVHARNLGRMIGVPLLHLKVEGMNPTGSFKDRGMVVAVAKALEAGAQALICASTGNTAASAAAYGAAVGVEVVVVLPKGQIAAGKLLQAQMAGAKVDRRRRQLRRRAGRGPRSGRGHADERAQGDAGQLGQPAPTRRPEDGGVRDLRGPRRGARLPGPPGRQRGQHHRLLAGLHRLSRRRPGRDAAARCSASRRPARRRW